MEGNIGHCPICGKFCADIVGFLSEARGLEKVMGICKTHGEVDLSNQDFCCEDFEGEEK